MLVAPLLLLALLNAWFDYQSAGNVAVQQDERLLQMLPLLADSVIGTGSKESGPLLLLMVPVLEEFIERRPGFAALAVLDIDGKVLHGAPWLGGLVPTTGEPEIHSEEQGGVTWRIARQRQPTAVGELVVALADGSDPRQQWARAVLLQVLLPNLVLIAAAGLAIGWAVDRALRPLLQLKEAVERRSPRDLSAIDPQASPEEVRPLVESLNRLFSLVDAQAESQRRFVADAAHQLRTPLAGLQAQVEAWAQSARLAGPSQETLRLPTAHIDKLCGATRRTSQLANQLLTLSRVDARSLRTQPTHTIDLKSICEDILEMHLDAAGAKGIDLGLEAQRARVRGDEWLLRELLANLVDNAIKYTPPAGAVTVRCVQLEDGALLEVEDDGPGIGADELPRVVERFYRVQGAQSEGSGLGLAIADEIARLHQSHLTLESGSTGLGLKVSLVLPVA